MGLVATSAAAAAEDVDGCCSLGGSGRLRAAALEAPGNGNHSLQVPHLEARSGWLLLVVYIEQPLWRPEADGITKAHTH
eukprot:scaffold71422_cov20-Tisochrysis_lutea.AAC.5